MYLFLPGLQNFFRDILEKNNIEFPNDEKWALSQMAIITSFCYAVCVCVCVSVTFHLNTSSLKSVTSPLLILHAEDDNIVPHHMGLKVQSPSCFISSCVFPPRWASLSPLQLYQISLQARQETKTDVQVEMISYSASHGFCHNDIYLDPNLSDAVG